MRPILSLFFLAAGADASAADRPVNSAQEFNRAVASAKPGDRILVAPGDYRGNFFFTNVRGTAEEPVVITAAVPAKPPRFVGKEICLQFSGTSHLALSNLVLTGASRNALNIDDADKHETPARHISLSNIRISDVGPKGNCDGIKMSGVDDFRIESCSVERWGSTGSGLDMVGCHRGVIVGCVFRKGGDDGIQAKGGSADLVIRDCKFEDFGARGLNIGGRTDDASFRPPLKTFPADGKYEARNVRVEGCTFTGGEAAVAFVGVDGAVVRGNTIYKPEHYAIRILQEKDDAGFIRCRKGVFENNIVVFDAGKWWDGGINVGPNTDPATFRFAGNLWYCSDKPGESKPKLPTDEKDGVVGKDPLFRDAGKRDFRLQPSSPAIGKGAYTVDQP